MTDAIDQFSYLHFASGITAYFFGFKLKNWMLLHLAFDIFDNSNWGIQFVQKYVSFLKQPRYGSDPPLNIIVDNIISVLGWVSAYYLVQYCTDRGYGVSRAKRVR